MRYEFIVIVNIEVFDVCNINGGIDIFIDFLYFFCGDVDIFDVGFFIIEWIFFVVDNKFLIIDIYFVVVVIIKISFEISDNGVFIFNSNVVCVCFFYFCSDNFWIYFVFIWDIKFIVVSIIDIDIVESFVCFEEILMFFIGYVDDIVGIVLNVY